MFNLKQSLTCILGFAGLVAVVATPFVASDSAGVSRDFQLAASPIEAVDISESTLGKRATADGTVQISDSSTFVATFNINDAQYVFTGNAEIPLPPTADNDAELSYTSLDQLQGQRSFQGTAGPNSVTVTLDNGPGITWDLIPPTPFVIQISGVGQWAIAE